MTPRQYTIALFISAAIAWTGFLLLLWFVNPDDAGAGAALVLLGAWWIALVTTLAGIGLRVRLHRENSVVESAARDSFRQALLVATVVVIVLTARHHRLPVRYTAPSLLLAAGAFEYLQTSRKRSALPPGKRL